MLKHKLPTLLLLPLAAGLYLLPARCFVAWRLGFYQLLARAAPTASSTPSARPTVSELRERLLQKDAQIQRLRAALAGVRTARARYPKLRFTLVRVLARLPDLRADQLVISGGRKQGLRTGDGLLRGQTLVGLVAQVGDATSQALSLASPRCIVAAVASGGASAAAARRSQCAVRGQGWNEVLAIFYDTQCHARPGDIVLTSGLLGRLPAGILIGRLVQAPYPGTEPGTMEARVEPAAALANLEHLLVVHRSQ